MSRRAVEVVVPMVAWFGPWVAFVVVANGNQAHVTRFWIAAGMFVAANLYVLFGVLLRKGARVLPRGLVFAGFVLTLSALVGTYAFADLVASRAQLACYHGATGGISLQSMDAVYYAISTLTTAGFGDIAAHSESCRSLTVAELAVGLTVVGLSIAAVAARLFEDP